MIGYGYIGDMVIVAYTLPDMNWYGYIGGMAIVVDITEYVIAEYYNKCYHEDKKEVIKTNTYVTCLIPCSSYHSFLLSIIVA